MVKISIVIPVYNMEKYIPCCLDSLAKQTLKEYEALCVDDGSTDDSIAVVREYAKKDKRVRSIPLGRNMGVFAARNRALECATGEFIAFLDPDDWYPEADVLEDMYETAKRHNVQICGGGWTNCYPDKPPQTEFGGTLWGLGCFKNPGVIDYRDYQFDFGYQRFIFSRRLLQENKITFPPYTRFQDPPFFVRAMHAAGRFYGMNRSTYNYRTSYKTVDLSANGYRKAKDMMTGLTDDLRYSSAHGLDRLHVLTYDRCNNCTSCYAEAIRHDPEAFAIICEMNMAWNWKVLDAQRKAMLSGYHPHVRALQECTASSEWKKACGQDPGVIKKALRYFAQYVDHGDSQETQRWLCRRFWQAAYDPHRPRVSILVPAYNVEKFLTASMESALAQTLADIEIICVDDGSSDGTSEILNRYAQKETRVVVLRHRKNSGLYMARKTAVLAAIGSYVTFLDSDDELFADACEKAVACAEKNDADLVHGRTEVNNVMGYSSERLAWIEKPTRPYVSTIEGSALLAKTFIARDIGTNVWGKLFARSLVLKAYASLPDCRITMAEDLMVMYPLVAFARKYVPMNTAFYRYTYGTGITGKDVLTLSQFRSQCDGLDIIPPLRAVRDGAVKGHRDRWTAYAALKDRILGETFGRIERFLCGTDDKLNAVKYFEGKLGSLEFVKFLAARYFGNRQTPILLFDRIGYVPQIRVKNIRRIGFVYFRLTMGGVQRVMMLLAPLFQQLGYEVIFILEEQIDDTCFTLPANVKVRYLQASGKCTAGNIHTRIQQLSDIIAEEKIDAVYYHEFSSNLLQWDLLVCKLVYRIPFVVHFHSCIGTSLYSATLTPEFSYLAAKMRMCDHVVTLSRTDNLYFRAQGVRSTYMPNPVDVRLRSVAAGDLTEKFNRKTVLWVARISWEKHPVDPITIFAEVHRKLPEARLVVVGGGPADVVASMQRKITECNLADSVTLAGNQTDAYPYYERASVFLLTSSFEGYALTLLEAGLHGLPTVMYDMPFLETIRDNPGISRVSQLDVKAAAAAICQILSDRRKYEEMALANRAHMERLASFDHVGAWKAIWGDVRGGDDSVPPLDKVDPLEIRLLLEELQYCYANGFKTRMAKIAKLEKDLRTVKDAVASAQAVVKVSQAPAATSKSAKAAPETPQPLSMNETARRVTSLAREVAALKRSEAYRVGMFVTWPLRKLASLVRK